MPEGEDNALLEAILLESEQATKGTMGHVGDDELNEIAISKSSQSAVITGNIASSSLDAQSKLEPVQHGGARDFSVIGDGATSGAARAGQQAAAVGEAVVATFREWKLGERLGSLGDKVLTNIHPDRVLSETVEVPVGILGWQLKLPEGWGPYLCLPVQEGTYTRIQLAASVQSLLQSTVGEQNLEWKVFVLARQRRLCFRLQVQGADERVCGFRLAPSNDLCDPFGTILGEDGWLTSEADVTGSSGPTRSYCAGHSALGGVPADMIPLPHAKGQVHSSAVNGSEGSRGVVSGISGEKDTRAPAISVGQSHGGGGPGGWREALRVSLGRHLEVASAELSDIGIAARQSGASMLKLMKHPIASFGVPLHVVVRREMEVVASCGGVREERPPIVVENLLSALDAQWGASATGALLLQQQHGLSSSPPESIYDTLISRPKAGAQRLTSQGGGGGEAFIHSEEVRAGAQRLASEDWQKSKTQVIALLDDSPGAPELASNRDAALLWEVLRSFLNDLPEPLLTFAAYQPIVHAAFDSATPAGRGGEEEDEAVLHRLWAPLQSVASASAAHSVTARRIFKFLHRHIFLLPIRRSGSLDGAADSHLRDMVLQRVALSIGLAVLRPSNDVNAASAALPAACEATQVLLRHAPALFP